jgi:hypothetical protein
MQTRRIGLLRLDAAHRGLGLKHPSPNDLDSAQVVTAKTTATQQTTTVRILRVAMSGLLLM